jgi:hypothetical protein
MTNAHRLRLRSLRAVGRLRGLVHHGFRRHLRLPAPRRAILSPRDQTTRPIDGVHPANEQTMHKRPRRHTAETNGEAARTNGPPTPSPPPTSPPPRRARPAPATPPKNTVHISHEKVSEEAESARRLSQHAGATEHPSRPWRMRGEIMGPGKYENVGESQSLLIMNDLIISPRTRNTGPSSWSTQTTKQVHLLQLLLCLGKAQLQLGQLHRVVLPRLGQNGLVARRQRIHVGPLPPAPSVHLRRALRRRRPLATRGPSPVGRAGHRRLPLLVTVALRWLRRPATEQRRGRRRAHELEPCTAAAAGAPPTLRRRGGGWKGCLVDPWGQAAVRGSSGSVVCICTSSKRPRRRRSRASSPLPPPLLLAGRRTQGAPTVLADTSLLLLLLLLLLTGEVLGDPALLQLLHLLAVDLPPLPLLRRVGGAGVVLCGRCSAMAERRGSGGVLLVQAPAGTPRVGAVLCPPNVEAASADGHRRLPAPSALIVLPGHRRAAVPPTNPCANPLRAGAAPRPARALLRGNALVQMCRLPAMPCQAQQQALSVVASMSKQSDCFFNA